MSGVNAQLMANPGTTGNNTHASVGASVIPALFAALFIVEAIGATPTVTWKIQASMDGTEVPDGSSTWFDLIYVTSATDTGAQTALTTTAVGSTPIWLDTAAASRFYRKYRLVTSANTNVTYRAAKVEQLRI